MRVTRESLLRIARETASQRAHAQPDLVAVYLTGSVLTENPFLGGTTDIDLVCVHSGPVDRTREVVPLSPEIHLDIRHNPRKEYDQPRDLRGHPWLGPELYDPLLLYQREHFFEFVQAAVRDKYKENESAGRRTRRDQSHARQIWEDLRQAQEHSPRLLLKYLKCITHGANALAVIEGPVLAERRFLLQFPEKAQAAGNPGLAGQLAALLGQERTDTAALGGMLAGWAQDFLAAGAMTTADSRIHPARIQYYRSAIEALLASADPHAVLWPLLQTWTLAAACLAPEGTPAWQSACRALGLSQEELPEKLQELDAFLDAVDEQLNTLGIPEEPT